MKCTTSLKSVLVLGRNSFRNFPLQDKEQRDDWAVLDVDIGNTCICSR